VYPYLLRGVTIEDQSRLEHHITYIPMRGGFLYLVGGWTFSATCSVGNCPTPWKPGSACALDAAFRFGQPKSGTPIKARNLLPPTFWLRSRSVASRSVWMDEVAHSTTFSRAAVALAQVRLIYRRLCRRPRSVSGAGKHFHFQLRTAPPGTRLSDNRRLSAQLQKGGIFLLMGDAVPNPWDLPLLFPEWILSLYSKRRLPYNRNAC